jgi:hypothetical protein
MQGGLVNFEKWQAMAEIVLELQQMQHNQVDIAPLPQVRHYLESYPVLSAQRIAELAQQELGDEPPGTATTPRRFVPRETSVSWILRPWTRLP